MGAMRCALAAFAIAAACGKADPPGAPVPKGAIDARAEADVPADARPKPPVKTSPPVDTSTGASPSYHAGPKVETRGSIDGAALRAAHEDRLAHDDSPVTVLAGGDARALGERICDAVVPVRPAATPILLKPNLTGFDWFKDPKTHHGDDGVHGRTTDPEFVRGVIECLKKRGHTAITVADSFGGKATDWDRLVKVSGYAAMAKDEGVKLVAMDDDGVWDQGDDAPGKPLAITGMEKTH